MNDKNIVLFVYPINGYVWEENGKPIEPPENFHIELRSEKEASVMENNHIFENLTIQITKRHVGKIDFSKSIAAFLGEIYEKTFYNIINCFF